MAEFDLLLAGGQAVLPGTGLQAVDIAVRDGVIAGLLAPGTAVPARRTVDVSGQVVVPGAVDAHVHLGQDLSVPKNPDDAALETASAAAGGVTTMLAYLMSPRPYEELFEPAVALMGEHAWTDFGFHFCLVTPDQVAALPRYVADFGVSSFKFFMNFRGDEGSYLGLPGNDDEFMLDLLEAAAASGAMVNPHAENIELVWRLRRRGRPEGLPPLAAWHASRPPYVEAEAEQRVCYLAGTVGASVYAVHVSCAESLRALRRQRDSWPDVFIETCPHYLTLDIDSPLGARGKVNPPLRTAADREALWRAVADGQVDTVGSDHVPRHFSAKDKDIWSASAGFPGTGTLLPLLVSEGHLRRGTPLERIAQLTATRPAQLFGLYPRKGVIAVGSDADLAVLDLAAADTVAAGRQHSGAGYSVWEDWPVGCRVVHTLLRGRFAVRDGTLAERGGRFVSRPRSGRAALDAARADAVRPVPAGELVR